MKEDSQRSVADKCAASLVATLKLWTDIREGTESRAGRLGTVELVTGRHQAISNVVASSRMPADVGEVESFADSLSRRGLPWSVQVRGVGPDGIDAIAEKHNLSQRSLEPLMSMEMTEAPEDRDGLGRLVRRIRSAEQELYYQIVASAYEMPRSAFGRRGFSDAPLFDHPAMSVFAVATGGVGIATARGTVLNDTVCVSHVAVAPAYRRRGYGSAVTAGVLRAAYADGARLAYLQSSQAALPLYERMGFGVIEHWRFLKSV